MSADGPDLPPLPPLVADYRSDQGGPLELAGYAGHPLVRALAAGSRRGRRRVTAVTVGAAAWALVVLAWAGFVHPSARWAGPAAGLFLALWPLAMLVGGALDAAGRVVAQRTGNTALHLVLTPLDKRPIAAAMILPGAEPWLAGTLAALPLYVLGAGSLYHWGIVPGIWSFWPFRFAAVPFVELGLGVRGVLGGLAMCFTDLALVWAAVHWGAAYAVRLASIPPLGIYVLWRLVFTALSFGLFYALCEVVAACVQMVTMFLQSPAAQWAATTLFVSLPLVFWWKFLLPRTVRLTLEEFAHFDRLADEEFRVKPVRGFSMWRDYGERP